MMKQAWLVIALEVIGWITMVLGIGSILVGGLAYSGLVPSGLMILAQSRIMSRIGAQDAKLDRIAKRQFQDRAQASRNRRLG